MKRNKSNDACLAPAGPGAACTSKIKCALNRLSLPDSALRAVLCILDSEEKRQLMACSRDLAKAVLLSQEHCTREDGPDPEYDPAKLKITCLSSWKGIKKILSWASPVILTFESPFNENPFVSEGCVLSAPHVLLEAVPSIMTERVMQKCVFPGVRVVQVHVPGMRCMIPPLIAATCPNMEIFTFQLDSLQQADPQTIQPLPHHTKLRKLVIYSGEYGERDDLTLDLQYHSVDELRRALPNISSLRFTFSAVRPLLYAWNSQITAFSAETSPDLELLQTMSKLATLQLVLSGVDRKEGLKSLPLPNPAPALHSLMIPDIQITDKMMHQLVQLPALTSLDVACFKDVQIDWSNYPCKWKRLGLHNDDQLFCKFGLVPVQTVEEVSVKDVESSDLTIVLPNPCDSDALLLALRAARNLSTASHINVPESMDMVRWCIPNNGTDEQTTELLAAASRRVWPTRHVDCGAVCSKPMAMMTLINWAASELETVCLTWSDELVKPWLWQSLRDCPLLQGITLSMPDASAEQLLDNFCRMVVIAAEHLVLPKQQPLTIQADGGFFPLISTGRASQFLSAVMEESLPDGVALHHVDVDMGGIDIVLIPDVPMCPRACMYK